MKGNQSTKTYPAVSSNGTKPVAQPIAPLPPRTEKHGQHDPVRRRRDKHGDPVPERIAFAPPVPDKGNADKSSLNDALKEIEKAKPATAHTLRFRYDRVVQKTLRRFDRACREASAPAN